MSAIQPLLVFPGLTVGGPVAFAEIAARLGAGIGAVFPALWLIGAAPIATMILTARYARRRHAPGSSKLLLVVSAGLWTIALAAAAVVVWLDSANIACHGGYECPF